MPDDGKFLEVGMLGNGDIVINHRHLILDVEGAGHIVFTPNQARSLARVLDKWAEEGDKRRKELKNA